MRQINGFIILWIAIGWIAFGASNLIAFDNFDHGFRLGIQSTGGWRQMGTGKDENDNDVISETTLSYHLDTLTLSYGFIGESYRIEPTLYVGTGSARLDGGRQWVLLSADKARFDTFNGTLAGFGILAWLKPEDSAIHVGLEIRALSLAGESTFKRGGSSPLERKYDATLSDMTLDMLMAYSDPNMAKHFKPYVGLGLNLAGIDFEESANPSQKVNVGTQTMSGIRVGFIYRVISQGVWEFQFEVADMSGLVLTGGMSFRF